MKQLIKMAGIGIVLMVLLNGCAWVSSPLFGALYTHVKGPIHSDAAASSMKRGIACATSHFGIIAIGDASIKAAMENGGITKVATVDYEVTRAFILWADYCTIVTGE